jgi:hypothetical protein
MKVQVVDRGGKVLPAEVLRAVGLGTMLSRIEGLWARDVGGAIAALTREGKARCEWDADEQKWRCVSSSPTAHCPGFEAVVQREGDEWFVVVRLNADWDGVWFMAVVALMEQLEELDYKVRRLEKAVRELAERVQERERKEEGEGWGEGEGW